MTTLAWEVAFPIALIAVLILGPSKLKELTKALGGARHQYEQGKATRPPSCLPWEFSSSGLSQAILSDGISPLDLKRLYVSCRERSLFLVDVRDYAEWKDWRIEGSTNIPVADGEFVKKVRSAAQGRYILAVCSTGARGAYAVDVLRGKGLKANYLREGLVGWSKVYLSSNVLLEGNPQAKLLQVRRMGKGCASYVLGYKGECVVIDPSSHVHEFISIAKRQRWRIRHVLDTHKHADHVSGAKALAEISGATLHLNGADAYLFDDYSKIGNGDRIFLGDEKFHLHAMHTPGHTKGSMSFIIADVVLTGDTLFLETIGRPDLHESDEESARELYDTCQRLFRQLDSSVNVLPSHFGPATVLTGKGPLSARLSEVATRIGHFSNSLAEFVKYVLERRSQRPSNYAAILRLNSGGDRYDPKLVDLLEEGPNRCASAN